MPDESPDPSPSTEESLHEQYVEHTDPHERAYSALLTPHGDRLTEIADRNAVDLDVLRSVAKRHVHSHEILIESDGEADNPRLYRNYAMDALTDVWREFSHAADSAALETRRADLEETIDEYREQTGYETPDGVLDAVEAGADLSHVATPDTDELFWDVVAPWRNALHRCRIVEVVLDNYDFLDEVADTIDMEVEGSFGDFSDTNRVEAKLGIEDQPPTSTRVDDEGGHDGDDDSP